MRRGPFRRVADGGGIAVFNNLLSLSWELLLDSRQIPAVADGTPIALWPDISGNGRDANPVPGFNPLYRPAGNILASPTNLPLADFGAVPNSQMFGTLPIGGVGNASGFSFYSWYELDSVPSAGAGDGQIVFGDDIVNGFRMIVSQFIGVGDMEVRFQFNNSVTGSVATTGRHTLTCICASPSGTGTMELFYDSVSVGTAVWTGNPQTTYLVSGNAAQNVWFRGRLGMVGFGKRVDSASTRANVESYLRRTWG